LLSIPCGREMLAKASSAVRCFLRRENIRCFDEGPHRRATWDADRRKHDASGQRVLCELAAQNEEASCSATGRISRSIKKPFPAQHLCCGKDSQHAEIRSARIYGHFRFNKATQPCDCQGKSSNFSPRRAFTAVRRSKIGNPCDRTLVCAETRLTNGVLLRRIAPKKGGVSPLRAHSERLECAVAWASCPWKCSRAGRPCHERTDLGDVSAKLPCSVGGLSPRSCFIQSATRLGRVDFLDVDDLGVAGRVEVF